MIILASLLIALLVIFGGADLADFLDYQPYNRNARTRPHYGLSGAVSISAAFFILFLL